MNGRRNVRWSVVAVGGLACAQMACSLKSLDYLKSGGDVDAPAAGGSKDGATDQPLGDEPRAMAGETGTGGAGPATGGAGGSGGEAGRVLDVAEDVPAELDGARRDSGSGGATGTGGRGGTGGGSGGRGGSGGTGGGRGGSAGTVASGGKPGTGGTMAGTGGAGTGGAKPDAAVSVCPGGQDAKPTDAQLTQGLLAYYPCDEASGTALPDQSGNRKDATLFGSPSFTSGQVGNALVLDDSRSNYAEVPAGILAGACEMTIAAWFYISSHYQWQRFWDFGSDTKRYMHLTPDSTVSGTLEFAITVDGSEQKVQVPGVIHSRLWTHVAVVLGPAGAIVYVDGAQAAASASVTIRPADLGLTSKTYIGRSQYSSDPYLDGRIDELRIYSRALAAEEIQALYNLR